MKVSRWMMPDGIEELLPAEAAKVEQIRRHLLNSYQSWGYQLVIPPLVEFVDALLLDKNDDLDLRTYKMMDRVSGKMLGLRADITAQIARIDAHAMKTEGPNRLCYAGSVVHTEARHTLSSRSPIQIGCELFGDPSVSADIEIVSLMLTTLLELDIPETTLALSHVAVLRRLLTLAQLSTQDERELIEVLESKQRAAIKDILSRLDISEEIKQHFVSIASIQGGIESAIALRDSLAGFDSIIDVAMAEVIAVLQSVSARFPEVKHYVDFTDLLGYHYHTGIVFSAIAENSGRPLANGGRYNETSALFGRARAATGFNADLKELVAVAALDASGDAEWIYVSTNEVDALWPEILRLRAEGKVVIQGEAELPTHDTESKCKFVLTMCSGEPKLRTID